jgi:hypothetical protein
MPRRLKKSACALLALSAVVAATTPGRAGETAFVPLLKWQEIKLSRAPADETMLHDTGPMIFLLTHSRDSAGRDWLKLETDECGMLQRVDNSRSIFRQSALSDDMEDFDGDDPLDSGRALVGQWLSQHSELAVINDGVDKSCDEPRFDDEEEYMDTFEIA